jgi:valyl-tRNA synthetase
MGWPNQTPDMERFFPGNLLETGHDILFFWVARMVMMSLHLTDKLPFKEVYLHAMVRDKDGRKMSKALGNVIDPLDVIYGIALQDLHDKLQHGNLDAREIPKAIKFQKEAFPEGIPECGSDALRFGLLSYTQSGRNVNLDIERIVGYRQFGNKLWNATRYILFHALPKGFTPIPLNVADRASLPLECRWILSRLDLAAAECNQGFSEGTYDFSMTTTAVYRFWLYELCDVFLELTKPVMAVEGERKLLTQSVLLHAVETGLRLLHPMMPFITEELYHRLPHHAALPSQSIMVAEYPQVAGWRDAATEADMALVQEVVHTVRSMKAQYALTPKVKPEVWIACNSAAALNTLAPQTSLVETLGGCGATVTIAKESEAATVPVGCGFQTATPEVGVHMMLKGFISVEKEVAKLAKAIAEKQKILDGHRKKLQVPGYDTKVPQAVRDANTEKEGNLVMELANLAEAKLRMEQLQ